MSGNEMVAFLLPLRAGKGGGGEINKVRGTCLWVRWEFMRARLPLKCYAYVRNLI